MFGFFCDKTIEFKWDLLERIKRNSEDWELNEGNESGINLKFDCVKSFMETDAFCSREKPVVKTMAPGSTSIIYKIQEYPAAIYLPLFEFVFYFIYLSLQDLILANNRRGD